VIAFDVARAWRDRVYRESLTEEQLASLPANPAGDLTDHELRELTGGSAEPGCETWTYSNQPCQLTNGSPPSYDPNCCSSFGWCSWESC
jgi:mersacidin/lichenicidin family type 2 lantibiotic